MRLKKLQEDVDRKAYNELVKDITPKKGVEEPFSSYKDQLGFGKHFLLAVYLFQHRYHIIFMVCPYALCS